MTLQAAESTKYATGPIRYVVLRGEVFLNEETSDRMTGPHTFLEAHNILTQRYQDAMQRQEEIRANFITRRTVDVRLLDLDISL